MAPPKGTLSPPKTNWCDRCRARVPGWESRGGTAVFYWWERRCYTCDYVISSQSKSATWVADLDDPRNQAWYYEGC